MNFPRLINEYPERGFTVVELVVAIFVIALFLTLFFQQYMVASSQHVAVIRQAAAQDTAESNLRKITTKIDLTAAGGAACDSTVGAGNVNNLLLNPNAAGSTIVWTTGKIQAEVIASTSLPPSTTQTLVVVYPQGCDANAPAEIKSTVSYGTESVMRAQYVN